MWERRIHPEDRDRALAALQAYLNGTSAEYDLEHRLLHKDGSYRWILARGAAVRDESGTPYRMVGSHLDVTRSKQAEETLRENTARLLAAQRIQEHLLPRGPVALLGYDIAGLLCPAAFAAGDHFDYLSMPGGTLGIVVGDVSGHGFDSAPLMASVHAYLRLLAETRTEVDEILTYANSLLIKEIELGRYVTLLMGRLDPVSHTFAYVNAGHPAGYLLDCRGGVKATLSSTSMPIGIWEETRFEEAETIDFAPGDILILLTDGILEAESPDGVPFGAERVLQIIGDHRRKAAADIISILYDAICEFSHPTKLSDDITGVVVKRVE